MCSNTMALTVAKALRASFSSGENPCFAVPLRVCFDTIPNASLRIASSKNGRVNSLRFDEPDRRVS